MRSLSSCGEGMSDASLSAPARLSDRGAACGDGPYASAILWKAMVTLSDKGAEKVHEFLASQAQGAAIAGLRVGVRGGGCSGFQYQLAFDERRESDLAFESHGITLLVDRESLPYVDGSTVDFEEGLQGAGFKVSNPNVVAACGCGSEFAVPQQDSALPVRTAP